MWHSGERTSSQRNCHIKRRRRRSHPVLSSPHSAFSLLFRQKNNLSVSNPALMKLNHGTGKVYKCSCHTQYYNKFDVISVCVQVTVADVDSDGQLELIAVDTSGNVLCFHGDGSTVWTSEASGSSSPGSRVADTNGDGILDVIVPTNEG